MLPFIDIFVEKTPTSFVTSLLRKPKFTGLNLSWNSFASKSRKINLIKSFTHRLHTICAECTWKALEKITDIYILNDYLENVLLNSIEFEISKSNNKICSALKCVQSMLNFCGLILTVNLSPLKSHCLWLVVLILLLSVLSSQLEVHSITFIMTFCWPYNKTWLSNVSNVRALLTN